MASNISQTPPNSPQPQSSSLADAARRQNLQKAREALAAKKRKAQEEVEMTQETVKKIRKNTPPMKESSTRNLIDFEIASENEEEELESDKGYFIIKRDKAHDKQKDEATTDPGELSLLSRITAGIAISIGTYLFTHVFSTLVHSFSDHHPNYNSRGYKTTNTEKQVHSDELFPDQSLFR